MSSAASAFDGDWGFCDGNTDFPLDTLETMMEEMLAVSGDVIESLDDQTVKKVLQAQRVSSQPSMRKLCILTYG
jgi:hypothetical protein